MQNGHLVYRPKLGEVLYKQGTNFQHRFDEIKLDLRRDSPHKDPRYRLRQHFASFSIWSFICRSYSIFDVSSKLRLNVCIQAAILGSRRCPKILEWKINRWVQKLHSVLPRVRIWVVEGPYWACHRYYIRFRPKYYQPSFTVNAVQFIPRTADSRWLRLDRWF